MANNLLKLTNSVGSYRFIDLFAGLGGFHQALTALGHNCVFACEVDENLACLYEKNFGLRPHGDIRSLDITSIPDHEVLCAGFPCQPFSKAGKQQGFECTQWGDLFDYVIRILRTHKPRYFIIENVPNLVRHNQGETWGKIQHRLRLAGYGVDDKLLSPHQFGIPQIRKRAFIVGRRGGLKGFIWPEPIPHTRLTIRSVLDQDSGDTNRLPKNFIACLNAWQEFLNLFPKNEQFPSFPIWAMEFGATYPYVENSPSGFGLNSMKNFRGSFGRSLCNLNKQDVVASLPSYARSSARKFPKWKVIHIRKNRDLYERHKTWIENWLPSILEFPPSFQKLEWNCKDEERDLWKYLIQFRASGVRVKRPTSAPSLVAMTTRQVPVIGWECRYMTVRECSRLQSMADTNYMLSSEAATFRALGNSVNVNVVKEIARHLIE